MTWIIADDESNMEIVNKLFEKAAVSGLITVKVNHFSSDFFGSCLEELELVGIIVCVL